MTERRHVDKMRVHLTFRCYSGCPYCNIRPRSNYHDAGLAYRELAPAEWLRIIRREPYPVILTGGEPALYGGRDGLANLIELVNGVPRDREVGLYTSLVGRGRRLAAEIRRPLHLITGYHPHATSEEEYLADLVHVVARPDWHGQVCLIDAPTSREANARIIPRLKELLPVAWGYKLDPDHWTLSPERTGGGARRRVRCTNRNIILAPDGVRYPCGSLMRRRRLGQEDARRERLRGTSVTVTCELWGACSPCDCLNPLNEVEFLGEGS